MHIIVIGAGIGGLAAALTLRRAGIDVRVFEQAAELREVGAGARYHNWVAITPGEWRVESRRNAVMFHLADGEAQRNRDANLASAATALLPQNAWLYGHDVEAEFEQA